MKTIAVKESTFQILESLKKKENAGSFDELLVKISIKEAGIPKSMFGANKKLKSFSHKEREEMWNDSER